VIGEHVARQQLVAPRRVQHRAQRSTQDVLDGLRLERHVFRGHAPAWLRPAPRAALGEQLGLKATHIARLEIGERHVADQRQYVALHPSLNVPGPPEAPTASKSAGFRAADARKA